MGRLFDSKQFRTDLELSGSFSGSFTGDGSSLTNVPASGIVGLNLSQIASGSATASIAPDKGFQVNVDTEITGSLDVTGDVTASAFKGDGSALTGILKTTGTPADNQIPIFTDSSTIEGTSSFTYNSTTRELLLGASSAGSTETNTLRIQGYSGASSAFLKLGWNNWGGTTIESGFSGTTKLYSYGDNAPAGGRLILGEGGDTGTNQSNYLWIRGDNDDDAVHIYLGNNSTTYSSEIGIERQEGTGVDYESDIALRAAAGLSQHKSEYIFSRKGMFQAQDAGFTVSGSGQVFVNIATSSINPTTKITGFDQALVVNGDITASGLFATTANITGSFKGNGSGLTNLKVGSNPSRVVFTTTDGELITESGFDYNSSTNQLTVHSINVVSFTSSFITASTIETSGSNIFGDEASDTHTFVGDIIAQNNISSSGYISGSVFSGDGSGLTNIPASGITGLNLSQIASGSATASIAPDKGFQVNTDTRITGSTNLSGSLKIRGSSALTGANIFEIKNTSADAYDDLFAFDDNGKITHEVDGAGDKHVIQTTSGATMFKFGVSAGSQGYLQIQNNGFTGAYLNNYGGAFGYGATVPTDGKSLYVKGDAQITGSLEISGSILIPNSGSNITIDSGSLNVKSSVASANIATFTPVNSAGRVEINDAEVKVTETQYGYTGARLYSTINRTGEFSLHYWAGNTGVYFNGNANEGGTSWQQNFIGGGLHVGGAKSPSSNYVPFAFSVRGPSQLSGSLLVSGSVDIEEGFNISGSATSTSSFGTYLGDGSGLTGVEAFPFSGSAIITGSLTVSGSVVDFSSASAVNINVESLSLMNPIIEYVNCGAITASGATVPLPNGLTYVSSSVYEYIEIFINGLRMRYDVDFIPATTSTIKYLTTIPSGSEITYKSLKRP
jgi:hypothetical protein